MKQVVNKWVNLIKSNLAAYFYARSFKNAPYSISCHDMILHSHFSDTNPTIPWMMNLSSAGIPPINPQIRPRNIAARIRQQKRHRAHQVLGLAHLSLRNQARPLFLQIRVVIENLLSPILFSPVSNPDFPLPSSTEISREGKEEKKRSKKRRTKKEEKEKKKKKLTKQSAYTPD